MLVLLDVAVIMIVGGSIVDGVLVRSVLWKIKYSRVRHDEHRSYCICPNTSHPTVRGIRSFFLDRHGSSQEVLLTLAAKTTICHLKLSRPPIKTCFVLAQEAAATAIEHEAALAKAEATSLQNLQSAKVNSSMIDCSRGKEDPININMKVNFFCVWHLHGQHASKLVQTVEQDLNAFLRRNYRHLGRRRPLAVLPYRKKKDAFFRLIYVPCGFVLSKQKLSFLFFTNLWTPPS